MQIENPFGGGSGPAFGGGATETLLHPFGIAVLIAATVLILVLPRKYVIGPLLLATFLLPLGQQFVTGGVHWQAPRIIVMVALVRMIVSRSASRTLLANGFNGVDWALFGCGLSQMVAMLLLYSFDPGVVYNQFGFLIDFIGSYCVVRAFIETEEDIYRALKWMAFITVILAVGMIREQMTLENIFGVIGGTRLIPDVRENRIRSMGVFQHSIIAGCFAATLLPLFFLLWKNGKARIAAICGVAGCTAMTITSNSSTPLLAYVAGIGAVCLWPLRARMQLVRRGSVAMLLVLQLVMIAPVWFLIARIDLTGGSSGYHRAELVDQFINHFRDWWLVGTKDAGTWGYDMWDQQNQFVNIGETGGILALVLFLLVITKLYKRLGEARRLVEGTEQEWLLWFLGAALFAHLSAFFGVNYFDQSKLSFYMLLAMISAATTSVFQTAEENEAEDAARELAPEPLEPEEALSEPRTA